MAYMQKLRKLYFVQWVSSNFACYQFQSSKVPFPATVLLPIAHHSRFYGRPRAIKVEHSDDNIESENVAHVPLDTRKQAQAALLDYLHSTRSLQFMDAENMSKNSPFFLEKLLRKVDNMADVGRSISRFLRYHPINEFEPFFESLGFKPSEYAAFLRRDMMFLSDDALLIENYRVLCNYGIARVNIGRIYREAAQVFGYGFGVLQSKLQAYEDLGLNQSTLVKLIPCSPYLLVGDVNMEFNMVIQKFKSLGIQLSLIEGQLKDVYSYNWGQMLELLCVLSKIGCTEEQLAGIINHNPGLLFEYSGNKTLLLVGLLLKLGTTKDQLCLMFLQFPQIEIGNFLSNLRRTYLFLTEIDMESKEIGKVVCSNKIMLGSHTLKKTNSLLSNLNAGKKRLCEIVQNNPQELKKWILGTRLRPLPSLEQNSRTERIKFLLDVGFAENSAAMEKAVKLFRGRGAELQERFDCLINAGLDRKDVIRMVSVSPQILNQTKNVIEHKICFLVNDMGYPVSTLARFPSYLSYTTQRVTLRAKMYNWVKDQGLVDPRLAMSTFVACSEKTFISQYVNVHPQGPQIWEELKNQITSE